MATVEPASASYLRGRQERLRTLERERSLFSKSAGATPKSSDHARRYPITTHSSTPHSSSGTKSGHSSNNNNNNTSHIAAVRAAISKSDATPEERLHVTARTVKNMLDTDFACGTASPPSKDSGGGGGGTVWRDYCCEHSSSVPADRVLRRNGHGYGLSGGSGSGGGGGGARAVRAMGSGGARRHARTASSEAWRLNVDRDGDGAEFEMDGMAAENPLLGVLESERTRYVQLEKDYHKLLSEVQSLQRSHRQELSDTERRRESHVRSLEKSVTSKSEECLAMHREIQLLQGKHSKEAIAWNTAKNRLDAQVGALEKLLSEHQARERDLDAEVKELTSEKAELSGRLTIKENEVRKMTQIIKDREEEHSTERKLRASLDEKLVLLEDLFSQREEELRDAKQMIQKLQRDAINEGAKHRSMLETAQRDTAQAVEHSNKLARELEQKEAKERKLMKQLVDISVFQANAQQNIDQLSVRFAAQTRESERIAASEVSVKRELERAHAKHARAQEEIAKLEGVISNQQIEHQTLQNELGKHKATAEQLRAQIESAKQNAEQLQTRIDTLKREDEQVRVSLTAAQHDLSSQQERMTRELQIGKNTIKTLQEQITDLKQKLSAEATANTELKETNHSRLVQVSDKIALLQRTLNESQAQLDVFRAAEKQLRDTLAVRDETIRAQVARIKDADAAIASLQLQLDAERRQVHDFKRQKKDEFLAINEKFLAAKQAMEHEGAALRSQLQQKALHVADLEARLTQLSDDLSEADATRAQLEQRIYDLASQEEHAARTHNQLAASVTAKEHEKHLLHISNLQLTDHNARLSKEVALYRSTADAKDTEIDHLRRNVADLTAKLSAQVQALLDREANASSEDILLPLLPNDTRYTSHRLQYSGAGAQQQQQQHQQHQQHQQQSSAVADASAQYDQILAALQHNVDEINAKLKPDLDDTEVDLRNAAGGATSVGTTAVSAGAADATPFSER
ncbi:hypothetical protein HDU86_006774 [Geranomyces michiganensis]|nr:hypothetical protein HDU86_006774 [Geranomyces michiganensis]